MPQFRQSTHEHDSVVTAVTVLPNKEIISGTDKGKLYRWLTETGECVIAHSQSAPVKRLTTTHNGWLVCASGSDLADLGNYSIELLQPDSLNRARTLTGHTGEITGLVTLEPNHLVSASQDGFIFVWDLNKAKRIKAFETHNPINTLIALDNQRVAYGSLDHIGMCDLTTGRLTVISACPSTTNGRSNQALALARLNSDHIISGHNDNNLYIWDITYGQCVQTLERDPESTPGTTSHAVDLDDIAKPYCPLNPPDPGKPQYGHRGPVTDVAVSLDGRPISCSADMSVRVWNLDTGYCDSVFRSHSGPINTLALMPNGRPVTGSTDKSVQIHPTPRTINENNNSQRPERGDHVSDELFFSALNSPLTLFDLPTYEDETSQQTTYSYCQIQ